MLVQFKRAYFWWETQKTYKLGEIIDVDLDQYKELISKGVANAYTEPPETEKEVLEGTNWVCFKKSINGFKCGEIVELDNKIAFPLIEKGIAMAAKEENETKKLLKSISKMNRDELLEFAKEKEIDTFGYKHEDLIRQSIKIALMR